MNKHELCACGKPLHYTDPTTETIMRKMVETFGPTVKTNCNGRVWLVPRHYIALHGLKATELSRLGFPEMKP